jgi:hypothetical protein
LVQPDPDGGGLPSCRRNGAFVSLSSIAVVQAWPIDPEILMTIAQTHRTKPAMRVQDLLTCSTRAATWLSTGWISQPSSFYESGYSLHTLRQARRRSWRIGQRLPVRVKFLCYEETMQTACMRLMGKKLLVALTMEGKFAGEGLQNIDEDDDMLSAMTRELVERNGIGETTETVWKPLNAEH